jgi:hypothetical protein
MRVPAVPRDARSRRTRGAFDGEKDDPLRIDIV